MEFMKLNNEKDIDILIDGHVDFGDYINHITRQVVKIKRSFIIRDCKSLLLMYKSIYLFIY